MIACLDTGWRGISDLRYFVEPEFIDMIRQGQLLGAGMQQPFLMGEEAVGVMDAHLKGKKVKQTVLLPVLPVSGKNIKSMLPLIQRNVLGLNVK